MAQVSIIRHNPIAIFSNPTEVIFKTDDDKVFRLIEPSGNVGTQYAGDVGSEWFGTIENLNAGLVLCGAHWSDVYKTDVLWTTPSSDRADCEKHRDSFNAVYGPMIDAVTGGPLRSNRMARLTHQEGFPDPNALFEVQVKAAKGEDVTVGGGQIDYGSWIDHQPSGMAVLHEKNGKAITTLGPDLVQETQFILEEQYEKPFAAKGVDFKTQTIWMEILVGVDDDPGATWERIQTVSSVFAEYFGDHRPAGLIYPVSRIPNMDSVVEPQPRVVSGDVEIKRSGTIDEGFSTWCSITYGGVTEVMVSAVGGDDAGVMLDSLSGRIAEAGGAGLKENGIFNNAYVVAGADSATNRAWIQEFNGSFSAWYEGTAPAGRTAQFVGGIQQESHKSGISTRAIFS